MIDLRNGAIFSVAFLLGAVFTAFLRWPPTQSSDWAAWVQAVGSIVAIFGAYFVGERQSRATLRAAHETHQLAERTRREGIFAVIQAAHARAKEFEGALDDETRLKMHDVYHPSLIDSLVELMAKLPVSELGSYQAINAFIIFSGQFIFLKKALDAFVGGPHVDPDVIKTLAKLKAQGYGNREEDQVIESKRAVLKKNVEVHLQRIHAEAKFLFETFPNKA
jgi:hypothetical protein